MITEPWKGHLDPIRIWGNLYFVGGAAASIHIIDTGDGLILLDCGYQETLYLLLEDMRKLGLDPSNIKEILITHGHIDHCGAAEALRRLYGCRLCIGAEDEIYVNGQSAQDLTYAKELNMSFISFQPDVLLRDGSIIKRGNTSVRCVATPGHTKGAMSFLFDVTDGITTYRAGLHGGMGINTLSTQYLNQYGLPHSLRDDFRSAMQRLSEFPVDIFLGNHAEHNRTAEKIFKVQNGEANAFVEPSEWKPYALWCIKNLDQMVQSEENDRLS